MLRSHTARIKNDRGFALVLVLVMLAILTLLGTLALNSSNTELAISGNYRTSQQAFFAAERAVEFAMANPAIIGSTAAVTDLNPFAASILINGCGLDTSATNEVRNIGVGELPSWLAAKYSSESFGGNYYNVSVRGQNASGRAKARIETQQVRIFQKDDAGTLITTAGG